MSSAREKILKTTSVLLEKQGSHATGLNEIIRESGSPKGSLYYYFPEGKDQIVSESVLQAGQIISERIRLNLSEHGLKDFILKIAENIEASNFSSGGPLTAVAMETATTNERINLACREAYTMLVSTFQEYFIQKDVVEEKAKKMATFVTASIEGGVILSRTNHSADALRVVAEELSNYLEV